MSCNKMIMEWEYAIYILLLLFLIHETQYNDY
jgi:hypothetical protein